MTQHSSEREQELDEKQIDYHQWTEHCIDGKIVLPPSQVLIYVWKVYLESFALDFKQESVIIEDMIMSKQVVIQPYSQQLTMTLRRGTNSFGVLLKEKDVLGETFLTGKLRTIPKPTIDLPTEDEYEDHGERAEILKEEMMSVLTYFGYELGKEFQTFKHMILQNKGFTAKVEWTGNMVTFLDALFKLMVFQKMEEEQQFLYPSSLRVLTVDSQIFHELETGTEIEVIYDAKVNVLRCNGLVLEGLILSPDPSIQSSGPVLHWKKRAFVPFNSKDLKLEEFLTVSVQLVADQELNSRKHKVVTISAFEIRNNNNNQTRTRFKFNKNLRDAINSSPHIVGKIQELDYIYVKDKLEFKPGESYLLMGDLKVLQKLVESNKQAAFCNVFFLAHIMDPQPSTNGASLLRPVFSYKIDEQEELVLLRKRTETKHIRVLEIEQESWFTDLVGLFNGHDDGHPVALVSRKWRPEELLPSLAKHRYAHRLRCIFLDPSCPKFSVSSPFYHNQLSLGLSVNIWAHRAWGSYFTINLDLKSVHFPETNQAVITSSDLTLDVNIVGLNTTNFTYQPNKPTEQEEIKYVDYCGTKENGKRVMGLSTFDSITNAITPDSSLSWQVPQEWSMEEAATVPSAFSLAYYFILVKAKATEKSVLVQIGSSPVGQACIAVCLQVGCDLFVTVESKHHIAPLLNVFPQLKPSQVFTIDHFKTTLLMMTKGKGVDVVINCMSEDATASSIGCLGFDSYFIHMSKCDLRSREIVGMGTFIKNANMYGCSLANIHNADVETKSILQNCILEGIKRKVVKPLKRRIFSLQKLDQAVKHLQTSCCEEKTVVVFKTEGQSKLPAVPFLGFHCQPENSFLIVGSGEGLWLDTAEWLIQRGARKLLIALDKDIHTTNFCRRFDRLIDLSYVRIMLTSASRIDCEENTADLIREVESLGPVSGIFCVALDENSPIAAHLDTATRQIVPELKQFVCLLGGSASVCQSRAELGLSSSLVLSESPLRKPRDILPYLSTVIAASSTFSHEFVVSYSVSGPELREDANLSEEDIHAILPSTFPELVSLANEVTKDPSLHEVVTRTLFHKEVRFNLLPVFVLPGTQTERLQPFLKNLMHPAYCVLLSEKPYSVERTAEILLQEVFQVQPAGPYNIVGESWSGAVAFHLAILLESQGQQVELFLLDAAPQTAQSNLQLLCERNRASLEVSLLQTIFDLEEVVVKEISELHSWEEQLDKTLQILRRRAEVRDEVWPKYKKSLTALRNHLTAVLAYKPQNHLFKGSMHLIRPKSASDINFCGLQLCSQKNPVIYVTEGESHEHMISNRDCAKIVNENILYTWNL